MFYTHFEDYDGNAIRLMPRTMRTGMHSPWGKIDNVQRVQGGPAMWWVDTPSHGGLVLSTAACDGIPGLAYTIATTKPVGVWQLVWENRMRGAWFEEDCEWSLPALWYPHVVQTHAGSQQGQAVVATTVARWYPAFAEHVLASNDHLGITPAMVNALREAVAVEVPAWT